MGCNANVVRRDLHFDLVFVAGQASRIAIKSYGAALALTLCAALSSPDARAQPARSEYRLYGATRHRIEVFSTNTLTGGRIALRAVDALTESIEKRAALSPLVAVAERAAVLTLVDLPILSYTLIVPHELFGHGARYREFDAVPTIHLDLPLPYSLRANHYVTHRSTRSLCVGEESVVRLGSLQAQEGMQRTLTATAFWCRHLAAERSLPLRVDLGYPSSQEPMSLPRPPGQGSIAAIPPPTAPRTAARYSVRASHSAPS